MVCDSDYRSITKSIIIGHKYYNIMYYVFMHFNCVNKVQHNEEYKSAFGVWRILLHNALAKFGRHAPCSRD